MTAAAGLHAQAWKSMLDEFLGKWSRQHNTPLRPFVREEDYPAFIDGRRRDDAVRAFLTSRGIELPFGDPGLHPDMDSDTICGLGNRKNMIYRELVLKYGVDVFETSVTFVKELKSRGIRVGVASTSENMRLTLRKAGLEPLFESCVRGDGAREPGLKGEPRPDIFVRSARDLGLYPGDCMMVGDSVSGVASGRRGNFGLVLGVAREVDGELLRAAGADMVVHDLGEITAEDVIPWFDERLLADGWNLTYHGFLPEEEKLRETLSTVGNGYFGTRGCFECERDSQTHYPGTYVAGLYNKIPTRVHGETIHNNDFVNCPNWLLLEFAVGDGEFLSPLSMELLSYRQNVNLRDGVAGRALICKDRVGRITKIHSRRIASMSDPHRGALRFELTPVNYSARFTFRSTIDGGVVNNGVARYRQLKSEHLAPVATGRTERGTYLHVRTNGERTVDVVVGARTAVELDGERQNVTKLVVEEGARVSEEFGVVALEGQTCAVEKLVSIHTSRDMVRGSRNGDLIDEATKHTEQEITFVQALDAHKEAWRRLWEQMDMQIEGDRFAQKVTRLHEYHLLSSASPHNANIDAGMTARGLHGEAYRGHVFWDEVYIFPFFNVSFPEITKALLVYRYRRLDAAREHAKAHGYAGAMFPWQTADDGTEETQIIHYNPVSGTWGPDESQRQRHVSIAVFANVWEYCERTGDTEFLHQCGAEMMLEIARFWASVATLDEATGKYHIAGVMGPDEYHEALPGSEEPGVKDNAYTNVMVVWLIEKTLALLKSLPKGAAKKVSGKIGFDPSETDKWRQMTKSMNVVMDGDIISQFDGYLGLEELDWDRYRAKHPNVHRMDRILKAEGDSPDRYKVAKQADVLMTYYLLPPEEVGRILRQLGHEVGDDLGILKANYQYYSKRTSHGSTLSKVVHAAVAKDVQPREVTWDWFLGALESDIHDTQGGTTIEGIHCAVMAGTLMLVIGEFAGVSFSGEKVRVRPALPEHWRRLSFSVLNRGVKYSIDIRPSGAKVAVDGPGVSEAVEVKEGGQAVFELAGGRQLEVDCRGPADPAAT